MFAYLTPQHHTRRTMVIGSKTQLSIAMGIALSCTALQVQAANNGQVYNEIPVADAAVEYESDNYENDNAQQVVSERLKTPNKLLDRSKLSDKDFVAKQAGLFFECTQVQTSAARLACFDKVAEQGETPSYINTKQPLDLAKTFKTTISGNPQVVFAEENTTNIVQTNKTDTGLLTNQSDSTESLDTVGLTQREAKVLENIGVTQSDIEKYTPLSLAYDLDKNSERGTWTVRPYRPTYVLPLFYTFDPNLNPGTPSQETESFSSNDIRETELKFQLSLKTKVAQDLFDTSADLWFGYTQESHWQVYNEDNSREFRATDYQPEIFLTQPVTADLPFGGRLRMLGVGAIHHSNGQGDPLSRSWNRAYLMAGAEWGKLSVIPRLWARVNNEDDSSEDNPDIEDYMGYGDVKFLYDLANQQSLSGTLRYNPSTNKGAAQIDYTYPLSENVNGFVQLFQGYGESIIDYNHENTSIGFGIVLNDWKGF
ncbi:phospholipase A [Psychrobacter sp. Sarcosine-3u-12]|uniref:phospholipase A n=1 Tax=Psychrobacter sp. Sarcosine-3u-12 TaxID=2058325 RepID=UPI000C33B2B4|nr:phospholipase A [Psychrobacter sp. Sarcosine-3u-12]PKG36658.1 phospholipase [Psychrobacter sp. Sarcosine-3u-12]